ncbi:MAG: DUF3048 domain-containing protein [Candidatus Kerfeldbacteria bacterium]|nr:DUF3048 domain-containing protein [Candidatus Kerfeldbacteria bacterium]
MKKQNTHRFFRVQFLRVSWLKDHHLFFALCLCAIVVILSATAVKAWKEHVHAQDVIEEDVVNTDENTNQAVQKKKKEKKEESVVPTELPRALDGVVVPADASNATPICVMIENLFSTQVRPQYGLSEASVVYEIIVEGGITRFMAVFPGGNRIDMIGPVRSARDTYLEFVSEYNCAYFHAGGSDTALKALYTMHLRHVDGLIEPKYFWRERSRYAPHNFFTSMDNLVNAVRNHHWYDEGAPIYTQWTFTDALTPVQKESATQPVATHIDIPFGYGYDVDYSYDEASNTYLRQNAHVAHMDAITDAQIAPKNIIIQHVAEGAAISGKGRINWPVTGNGAVEIFHDGRVYIGTWVKKDRLSRTEFFDLEGKPIPLTRGQSWVEIVPPHITSSYN